MILKIWDEREHAMLYFDKIERFKIVYPGEMQYYLGEVLPSEAMQDYYFDEKNNRKLLVRLGPSPDYDKGCILPDKFLGILEEIELYDRLGMINFQQNGSSKDSPERIFAFSRGLVAYLLNDEGKTVERL